MTGAPRFSVKGLGGVQDRLKTIQLNVDGGNKYMTLAGCKDATNTVPYVWSMDVVLVDITYTNKATNSDGTLDIRKNGIDSGDDLFNWTFTDIDEGYKTDGLSAATFVAGDTMTVFMNKSTTQPRSVHVSLTFKITDDTVGEVS